MYEILWKKLSAYNNTQGMVNSCLHKIVAIYMFMLQE